MVYYGKELYHWGVKGQKWGERNYQNEDGSYTVQAQNENNGHGRYADDSVGKYDYRGARKELKSLAKERKKAEYYYLHNNKGINTKNATANYKKIDRKYNSLKKEYEQNGGLSYEKKTKVLKTGAIIAASILAIVGGYQLTKYMKDQVNIQKLKDAVKDNDKMKNLFKADAEFIRKNPDSYKNLVGDAVGSAKEAISGLTKNAKAKDKANKTLNNVKDTLASKYKFNITDKVDLSHPFKEFFKMQGGV